MTSIRAAVRESVKKILINATEAGERVYKMRMAPLKARLMPALSIYTLDETIDEESIKTAPRYYQRRLLLQIEGVVAGRGDSERSSAGDEALEDLVDDRLDSLAAEVETALVTDETLGGLVGDLWLSRTELVLMEQGEDTFGVARMTFTVLYETEAINGPAPDGKFITADVRESLSGAQDEADQAHDIITLPQD